jgi:hypothetical protein
VLVYTQAEVDKWADVSISLPHKVLTKGKLLFVSTANKRSKNSSKLSSLTHAVEFEKTHGVTGQSHQCQDADTEH